MHNDPSRVSRRLVVAIIITVLFVVIEAASGLLSNSLALISDAAHNLTDVIALGLSFYALHLSTRPASSTKTYGYHRAGILVALLNAGTLIGIALFIFAEAWHRLFAPPPVQENVMILVALIGLAVNTFIALALRKASRSDLNVRSAFVHMAGDALSTLGVIGAGLAIELTGWQVFDPAASILIGAIIAVSSWGILREGVDILLEGTPRGIDMDAMVHDLLRIEGVRGVHDLHAWSITPDLHALSAHVLTENVSIRRGADIQRDINHMLVERYNIAHTALQLECEECSPDALYCELGANGGNGGTPAAERRHLPDRRKRPA